jgi:DnaJ-class molecular chaperone
MRHDEWEDEYGEEEHHQPDTHGPFRTQCAFCKGTGVDPATMKMLAHELCPVCKGLGVQDFKGDRSSYIRCSKCGGEGKEPVAEPAKPCSVCCGRGLV